MMAGTDASALASVASFDASPEETSEPPSIGEASGGDVPAPDEHAEALPERRIASWPRSVAPPVRVVAGRSTARDVLTVERGEPCGASARKLVAGCARAVLRAEASVAREGRVRGTARGGRLAVAALVGDVRVGVACRAPGAGVRGVAQGPAPGDVVHLEALEARRARVAVGARLARRRRAGHLTGRSPERVGEPAEAADRAARAARVVEQSACVSAEPALAGPDARDAALAAVVRVGGHVDAGVAAVRERPAGARALAASRVRHARLPARPRSSQCSRTYRRTRRSNR